MHYNGSTTTSKIGVDGSATFARNVTSGGPDIFTGTDKGSIIGYDGNIGACCGASSSALRVWTQGTSTPTVDILGSGSATFAGDIFGGSYQSGGTGYRLDSGGALQVNQNGAGNSITVQQGGVNKATITGGGAATFAGVVRSGGNPDSGSEVGAYLGEGTFSASRGAGLNLFTGFLQGDSNAKVEILSSGAATFEGNITAANVTFNLEPDNPANYTTTEEEYEVEVPVLFPNGVATTDLVDGEPEQQTRTVTRTREVTTYTGPTMDVKDALVNALATIQQLSARIEALESQTNT